MINKGGSYTTDFSEFTFGYALTRAFERKLPSVLAVPSFPSLLEEGQPGGGFDVRIQAPISPLFLQFKVPRIMKRHSSRSAERNWVTPPHYRMYLHRRDHSNQQNLLIELANKWDSVYYASPEFESKYAIDDYHRKDQVVENTIFFEPREIGPLADDKEHYVAYERGQNVGYLCSAPKQVRAIRLDTLERTLFDHERTKQAIRATETSSESFFEALLDSYEEAARKARRWDQVHVISLARRSQGSLSKSVLASYLAQVVFDCQLLVWNSPPS